MNIIEQFYDADPQHEWERLAQRHRTEYALTLRVLGEHLPAPPARVLDIGGSVGRYSIALAQQGYSVTLFDLSQACLDFAAQRATEAGVALDAFVHGNAINLSQLPNTHYDVVLLMGPLYHLIESADRDAAIREALRVLKPGGILAAAFIIQYSALRSVAWVEPDWIIREPESVESILSTGVMRIPPGHGFIDAWLVHPSEVRPLFERYGLRSLDLIACEGIISLIEEQVNETQDELWDAWVNLNYRLCRDPWAQAAADHLLYIGMKPLM